MNDAKQQELPIRVALVALHFAEYSIHLARALATHADILLVLYRNNFLNEVGKESNSQPTDPRVQVLVIDAPRSIGAILRNAATLISAIRSFNPTLIHYQENIRDELILALPFFRSIPRIMTIHDPAPHSGRDADRLRYSRLRLYRYMMRRKIQAAITHGHMLAKALEAECPWLVGRVLAIPHGPLGANRHIGEVSAPQDMRLLFFGRIHKYKGLAAFVQVVTALREEGLPVVGVVAGNGSDLEQHRESMMRAGCFEILDRYIPVDTVSVLFQGAKVVVLPYTDGTQSGVAALALGHARPVVATEVGSIPELVRHGVNGLLVPPHDAGALKDAVRSILQDNQLWHNLASGAVGLRDGELSWATIARQTRAAYEAIVVRRQY